MATRKIDSASPQPPAKDARERILEAGAALVHKNGFHNTGLKDILEASGVPKGSFYFYFKNKEAFGLELIDHHLRYFGSRVSPILANQDVPPTRRILDMFAWFRSLFTEHGFIMGCPIGNLAQEMSDLSPAFRDRLALALDSMAGALARVLAQARERGELDPAQDPHGLAEFLVASWEGALLMMKVAKSARPLELFEQQARRLMAPPRDIPSDS